VDARSEKAVVATSGSLDSLSGGKYAFNCEWRSPGSPIWIAIPTPMTRLTDLSLSTRVGHSSYALYWLFPQRGARWKPCARAQLYGKTFERSRKRTSGNARAALLASLVPAKKIPRSSGENPRRRLRCVLLMSRSLGPLRNRLGSAAALRAIAFDASAEQELKNAYFATSSPRFLLEAAQALSIKATRRRHGLRSQHRAELSIPGRSALCAVAAWKCALSRPYEATLRRSAANNDLIRVLPRAHSAQDPLSG